MIKVCKDCNCQVGKDRKTGKWWCPKCKAVKEDYDEKYRIAVMGKNTGRDIGTNNMARCLAREWEKMGHEVIEINRDALNEAIQIYDMENCYRFKKPISLRLVEYYIDPDFIFLEQMYNRFDTTGLKCPVVYQHREYTHFPDIDNPDILFGSYPFRIHFFEQYNPWGYHNCKYRDDNFVAVNPELFPVIEKKVLKGISYMGWSVPPEHFSDANGIVAKMVIEDQVAFMEECRRKGVVSYIKGESGMEHYINMLGRMEAVLIDGGYINGFGRTLFEAMAMKTLCIVRVHHNLGMDYYKKIGLTEDMCYFVSSPEDIEVILENWLQKERQEKVEKAYEWVMKYHTYEVRARETLEKFEEFKRGETKTPYFMGYAKRARMQVDDGQIVVEVN